MERKNIMKKYNFTTITHCYEKKSGKYLKSTRKHIASKLEAYFSIFVCETILFFKGYRKIKIDLINNGISKI